MIKIRNKRIALLLVLAMLATLFVGVGTASAATNFTDVNSTYTYVSADSNQESGIISITSKSYFTTKYLATTPDTLHVEIALPDGVTTNDALNYDYTWSSLNVSPTGDFGSPSIPITIPALNLDIDSSFTGSISASVHVWGTLAGDTVFDEASESTVIAKVSAGDTTVSAATAKNVTVGSGQLGAKITVKENSPSTFEATNQMVKFTIATSGVTWDTTSTPDTTLAGTYTTPTAITADGSSTDKTLVYYFNDNANELSKVILTPYFKVAPNATGDITVKVSGDNITTTSFVIAKVGAADVNVTVKNADEDSVFVGQTATLENVEVKLDPVTTVNGGDYFTMTLPAGVKFQDVADPVLADTNATFNGLYSSDHTAWFTFNADSASNIKLSNFQVVADYNAVPGDLNVTFAGAVTGTYKIGTVKAPFTVSTTPFALTSGATSVKGSDIVITETADGALTDASGYVLDIQLPSGVTFNGTPAVDVTTGDVSVGDVSLNGSDTLEIAIDGKSNIASTITISNLSYYVLNQPMIGDISAKIGAEYNQASSNPLMSLVIGSISTNPTAVYVIGAPTFTVNGVVQNVVTPSYVKNDRTYLAIRDIATGLGIDSMNVLWDEVGQKVTLVKGDKIVQVAIGSTTMYVNGVAVAMDVAPEINNDRTMLPAAFLAQAFGATASWDALTSTVTIK